MATEQYTWTTSTLPGYEGAAVPDFEPTPDDGEFNWVDAPLGVSDTAVTSDEDTWDNGLDSILGNTGISMFRGAASGVSAIGGLLDAAGFDVGNEWREKGESWEAKLRATMSPEWQQAIDKSWASLDPSEAGWADYRSWMAGIGTVLPWIIGTAGVGGVAALGLRAVGVGEKIAVALGFGSAGAVATAGDAASSAASRVDEAGLGEEERRKAARLAAALSLPFGVAGGLAVGKLVGKATGIGGRVAAGILGEGVEEAGTELSAQMGANEAADLPYQPGQILEAGVQGAALGGGTGVVLHPIVKGKENQPEAPPPPAPPATDQTEAEVLKLTGPKDPRPQPGPDGTMVAGQDPSAASQPQAILALKKAAEDKAKLVGSLQTVIQNERNPAQRAKLVAKFREERAALEALETELALNAAPEDIDPNFPTGQTSEITPFPTGQSSLLPPRALPSPADFGRTVRPATDEPIVAEGAGPEAGPLAKRIETLGAQLTSLQEKIDKTAAPGQRAKLMARFKETSKQYRLAEEQYGQVAQVRALTPEATGDFQTIPVPTPEVDIEAALEQIDAVMQPNGVPLETPAAPTAEDMAVARSQRARAAAATRKAKRTTALPPETSTPEVAEAKGASEGNPEVQAIAARSAGLGGPGEARTEAPAPTPTNPPAQAASTPDGQNTPPGAPVSEPTPEAPAAPAEGTPASDSDVTSEATEATPVAPRHIGRTLGSPRAIILDLLSQGPQPVDTVLSALSKRGKFGRGSHMVTLISRLRRAFPGTQAEPSPVMVELTPLPKGYQALYNPKTDKIQVSPEAEDILTATLHETVHAAVVGRLRVNEGYRKHVEHLMLLARKAWDKHYPQNPSKDVPAFRNVEEFMAEALTNTEFQDYLATMTSAGPRSNGGVSFWSQLKNSILRTLRYAPDFDSSALIEQLMQFIPDGAFMSSPATRAAVMAELDRLGLHEVAPLFSVFRAAMRKSVVAQVPPGKPNPAGRVWSWLFPFQQTSQLATSYGAIGRWYRDAAGNMVDLAHDVVNRYYRLISAKAGFIKQRLRLSEQIVEFYKNVQADPKNDNATLDNLLVDARLWRLHPDLAANHPLNATGINQPGGTDLHRELQNRWAMLTPAQKYVSHLLWANSRAIQSDWVNQMMIARVRGLVGAQEADRLSRYVESYTRTVGIDPAIHNAARAAGINPIEIRWQAPLTAAEVSARVATMGLTPQKTADTIAELNKVYTYFHRDAGPFVPLRRLGQWMVILRSPKRSQWVTRAQLDRMVVADRLASQGAGELVILDVGSTPNAQGQIKVDYEYMMVSSHETEADAREMHAENENRWRAAGRTFAPNGSKYTNKRDSQYAATGLTSPTIEALRKDIETQLGPGSGPLVSEMIMKFYLERLPDTSIRKSQMKARRIAGADRDMLKIFAGFAHGTAYMQGAMRFQPQIGRLLTTEAEADIATLQSPQVRQYEQGIDLNTLVNEFSARERSQMDMAANHTDEMGFWSKAWVRMPTIAAAYFLTGLGTIISNGLQPALVSTPVLGAKHGFARAAANLLAAYKDIIPRAGYETGAEIGRTLKGAPRSLARIAKGEEPASFRNPDMPFFEFISARLPIMERQLIKQLADIGKIDYGMIADLQSMIKSEGRAWSLFNYLSAASFILPQAMETINRTVTALASYRMNSELIPIGTPGREAKLIQMAADDIDATQLNYERANKAPIMAVEALRVVGIFKTYAQGIYYLILRSMSQAMFPDTATNPKARSQAIKVIGGLTAGTFVASGAMGLLQFDPLYYAALAATMAFSDDDDPEDLLRKAMADMPTWLSRTLLRGVPYGSAGEKWPGLDLGRVGLPALTPVTDVQATISNPDAQAGDWFQLLGETFLGPPGGIAVGIGRGAAAMAEGNINEGLRLALPKTFGFNDIARAWEYHNQGVLNSKGEQVMTPEEVGVGGAIVRFLGFEPTEVAEAKRRNRRATAIDRRLVGERKDILESYAKAVFAGDQAGTTKALRKLVEYNRKYPERGITRETIENSLRQRATSRALTEAYGGPARTVAQRVLLQKLNPLYGIDPTGRQAVGL